MMTPATDQLRQRIAQLEACVESLETRLTAIETEQRRNGSAIRVFAARIRAALDLPTPPRKDHHAA